MPLKPFAGLGSWAAFTPAPHGAMVMGDTVVFQDEVDPAMDAAFADGLEVTGLHNHFFYDEPKVYFMHIGGTGRSGETGRGGQGGLGRDQEGPGGGARARHAFPGEVPEAGDDRRRHIEKILGHKAEIQDGVVKVTIGREGTMHGVKVGGSMGLTTWAAFSGGDDLAAVDGDFIMTAAEVQPVLRALRKAGHPHRRPAQPHDRRAAGLLLHPLLGQGAGRGAGPRAQVRARRSECGGPGRVAIE